MSMYTMFLWQCKCLYVQVVWTAKASVYIICHGNKREIENIDIWMSEGKRNMSTTVLFNKAPWSGLSLAVISSICYHHIPKFAERIHVHLSSHFPDNPPTICLSDKQSNLFVCISENPPPTWLRTDRISVYPSDSRSNLSVLPIAK